MACRVWSLTCSPSKVYREGRRCTICGAFLSVYNPDPICACHPGKRHFNLDAFIDDHAWPSYLPDPSKESWRYTPDELALLSFFSRSLGRWLHLDYLVVPGGAQTINNAIRKLRRKGFSIRGRKSGGYLLEDRIPSL